jgi:streptogramin lyase
MEGESEGRLRAMRSHATKLVTVVCVLAVFLLSAATASAAPFLNGIFPLGSEVGTNNKIVDGPDGNVWLTLGAGKDIARITPAGQVQEFDLDGVEGATGIAPGPDGNLWVPSTNKVTRFSPADPEGTDQTFTVNTINNEGQIVTGPEGLLWVASANSVVHFAPGNPEGTAQSVAVDGELAPKDIDVAGSLIVIADASGGNRLVTFTTAGVQQDLPIAGAAQGVAGGPGGQIAYSAPVAEPEQVGLITPPNPALPIPVPGDPFGVDLGPDGTYWVAQFLQGGITRFTPTGQATFLGGLPIESPRQITAGPGNTLWVTLSKMGAPGVARISGVDPIGSTPPPPLPQPQTKIDKSPKKVVKTRKKRAKVKFRFSSATPGVTFECWLMRVSKKAQLAILKYKACKSPKIYRLRPGKYKFRVRAVNGGVPDLTPAVRNFRIVRIR